MHRRRDLSLPLALGALLSAAPAVAVQPEPGALEALRYRFVGPDGNRAIAVAGVPGDPAIYYVGAASGGIFKTVDGGLSFEAVFDDHDVASVGSLAIAPSDANVVYAGTGETFLIRPAVAMGNGLYRSTDAGATWSRRGLERTGRIGRIAVDPRDPDVVLACALGHAYGPQPERGVYRSDDGGESWAHVLFVDENTGCSDLAMDPTNPRILFAGLWQLQIDPWNLGSGGPGSGVYRSRDGGRTWERLSGRGGLPGGPEHPLGKVAVAVAASQPTRVYALVEDRSPGFYASDDRGESWRLVSQDHTLNERAPYYTRFAVSPRDADRVYFASVRFSLSIDGGETIVDDPPAMGGDTHDVWIDPLLPERMMVADDGGVTVTLDGGRSVKRQVLPIAQMYHVAVDDRIPYHVYGNRQDGYSYRGPSNSLSSGGIPIGSYRDVGGCESGWALPVPPDWKRVWSGCYDGGLELWDERTGHARNVRVWPEASYGWKPADVRYRWHWSFPIAISPHDPERVYVGSQYLHRTEDGGQSWSVISPDLTLDDESHQQDSGGGLTIDNLYTFDGSVLYAIAESPLAPGALWTGSVDGQVQLTRDGGGSWINLSGNLRGLPANGQVMNVEPSRFAAGKAYLSVSRHQLADFDPYLFRTRDFGASWERIDAGIPRSPLSFVHVVREDPKREGMLYAGTDNGVWVSLDDGKGWFPLQSGLPPAPVYWIEIQERFDDLVLATYGRGFYILDDVTPLRALDASVLGSDVHLFEPREAWRFRPVQGIKTGGFGQPEGGSHVTGSNPEYGASLHLWLREPPEAEQPLEIRIADREGAFVRSLELEELRAGLNRVHWDLRHEPPREPKLRTPPPEKDWVNLGPDGTRKLVTWDLDLMQGQQGPLVVPGRYSVTLVLGERELSTELRVLKDPGSAGSEADVAAQVALALRLRDWIGETAGMIDELEWIRRQLIDLKVMLADVETASAVVSAAGELEPAVLEVEGRLFDVHLTGAREDAFRSAMKLYGRLSALASDVSGRGADFPPTDQQLQVAELLGQRLEGARRAYRALLDGPVAAFDAHLEAAELPERVLGRSAGDSSGRP